jgi:hypothetical protein
MAGNPYGGKALADGSEDIVFRHQFSVTEKAMGMVC